MKSDLLLERGFSHSTPRKKEEYSTMYIDYSHELLPPREALAGLYDERLERFR